LNINFIVFGGMCLITSIAVLFIRNHEQPTKP